MLFVWKASAFCRRNDLASVYQSAINMQNVQGIYIGQNSQ